MADVNFKTVRVLMNTSTGTQDITIPGFGTPKAAIFFFDIDVTDDTIRTTVRKCKGYTDGTNQGACSVQTRSGQAASQTNRIQTNDSVIIEIDQSSVQSEANFDSWVTDGVRIDITQSFSARFLTVVLINGDDVTDTYVELSPQLTSTTNNINTVGFEPDLVLMDCIGLGSIDTHSGNLMQSSGIAINDGTNKNMSVMSFDTNSASTTVTGQITSDIYAVGQYFNDSLTWGGVVENYDSQGFNINTNASTGNDRVLFLALKFANNPLIELTQEDSPTATGSKSFGSTGSAPSFNLMITGNNSVINTGQSNLGYGIFTADSSNQYGMSYSSEDARTVDSLSNTISKSGGLVQLLDGAKQFDSTFTNFTATGADFNFTAVDGAARKWISLFIGGGASGGISIPVIMNQLRIQGIV